MSSGPRMVLLLIAAGPATAFSAPARAPQPVGRAAILAAMMEARGYSPTATTNGARFQAEVLLRLAREAQSRDPERAPLLVDHAAWFSAVLERAGLSAQQAPAFVRLGYEYKQDIAVDYAPGQVVKRVVEGPMPAAALSVRIGWTRRPGGPQAYSYEDTLSNPKLKVTNKSLITYRLLDFGDMVVYDEIEGLHGRPTSGILGFLFSIIGEGHVVQNRMAISDDGLQVSRARAEKAFMRVVTTVTVYGDGRTEKDVPADRPDLRALEARLKQPLRIEYFPIPSER